MSSTLVIANFRTGYETNREPFIIDNDAFPVLNNAFIWRGRARKKRGTKQLGRLERTFTTASIGVSGASVWSFNIYALLTPAITAEPNSQIIPGSVNIVIGVLNANNFTDNGLGILEPISGAHSGTINYLTGAVTITGSPGATATTISFSYWPALPVMGIEDYNINFNLNPGITNFPNTIYFDTKYAYTFNDNLNIFQDITFYYNTLIPFNWTGQTYQQFWSTNYQGAMWVTNAKPGFHFKAITGMPVVGNVSQFTIVGHGLSNNDYVFINEIVGVTNVNGVSGQVTVIDANTFSLSTPGGAGAYSSGGIAQYLTQSVPIGITAQDGIRWYSTSIPANSGSGWVNFAPPLSDSGLTGGSTEYLVGAKIIYPFKDRLLFFCTYTQTSSGSLVYNANQVISSQNGTCYYALPDPFNTSLDTVLPNTTSDSYWLIPGKGNQINAPIEQELVTLTENEDCLICGYEFKPLKLYSTGDDSYPFLFQTISSEYGSEATFSGVSLDSGAITMGPYGISMTSQTRAERIDTDIPDEIFGVAAANNGNQRVTAIRDWRNEFIYFTYPPSNRTGIFPNKTLLYSYKDGTWATFDENYTHYGTYRRGSNITWASLAGSTWAGWTNPWNFGATGQRYPDIVGGNQHGFVMIKDAAIFGTREDYSQMITGVSGALITSPNHSLNSGDYIEIAGSLGVTNLNGGVYKIQNSGANTFTLLLTSSQPTPSGVYLGSGTYRRLTNFFIQTRQFPVYWDKARRTRIGTQRFLLDNTANGQITVNIYTSQDNALPVNDPLVSDYLIYSNIVLTSAEPGILGSNEQAQIWHRMSNSFIGDTVQLGFTLSDAQMRDDNQNSSEVTIHAIAIDLYPGPILS